MTVRKHVFREVQFFKSTVSSLCLKLRLLNLFLFHFAQHILYVQLLVCKIVPAMQVHLHHVSPAIAKKTSEREEKAASKATQDVTRRHLWQLHPSNCCYRNFSYLYPHYNLDFSWQDTLSKHGCSVSIEQSEFLRNFGNSFALTLVNEEFKWEIYIKALKV